MVPYDSLLFFKKKKFKIGVVRTRQILEQKMGTEAGANTEMHFNMVVTYDAIPRGKPSLTIKKKRR